MNRIVSLAVRAGLLATIVPIAGACATSDPSGAIGSDQGVALSQKFGACSTEAGETADPMDYLAGLTPWRHVLAIGSTAQPDDPALTGLLEVTYTETDGTERTALLGESELAGVRWGVANKADVWFGIEAPKSQAYKFEHVGTSMVMAADDVFFPGDCANQLLYVPVHDALGADADATMLKVAHSSPQQAQSLLGLDQPQERPTDEPVVLNPETAPRELLESLRMASLQLSATDGDQLDDTTTICTHIAEGWNDCVPSSRLRDGVTLGAYVGDSGIIEFWLMDASANLTSPLGYLGSINVGNAPSPRPDVVLDANGLKPDLLPQAADGGATKSRVQLQADS